jgi:hypothetical protein
VTHAARACTAKDMPIMIRAIIRENDAYHASDRLKIAPQETPDLSSLIRIVAALYKFRRGPLLTQANVEQQRQEITDTRIQPVAQFTRQPLLRPPIHSLPVLPTRSPAR